MRDCGGGNRLAILLNDSALEKDAHVPGVRLSSNACVESGGPRLYQQQKPGGHREALSGVLATNSICAVSSSGSRRGWPGGERRRWFLQFGLSEEYDGLQSASVLFQNIITLLAEENLHDLQVLPLSHDSARVFSVKLAALMLMS